MTQLADLASEQYVSLTTFRRTGEPVATPVWVAAEGPHLVVRKYGLLARVFFATDAVARRRQRVVLRLRRT